jgi:essential nuclear protein 1
LRTNSKKRKAKREDDGDHFVDSRSSRKILKIGQELAEEDQLASKPALPSTAFTFESRIDNVSDLEDEQKWGDEEAWGDVDEAVEETVSSAAPGHSAPART